jgi:prepilin-type processing-associated H-X9-DG protein
LYFLSAMLGLSGLSLAAQSWDAATQARSWAKQDRDDSFTFFDPATRMLHTWLRDGGVLGSTPAGKSDEPPERWVMDPRNNAWVAHGTTITQIDKTGHVILNLRVPAEVGDICWDAKGFVLSFKALEPYLERRDFKGALLWSFGTKPAKSDGPAPQNRRPVVMDDAGNVLMADGHALNLTILEGSSGRRLGQTNLLLGLGQPAPALEGYVVERGPLAVWPGRGVVFAAVQATQVPAPLRAALQGLALARLDLAQSRLEFLPTGLDESHILIGVLDSDAVFVNPRGGLMLVKVK